MNANSCNACCCLLVLGAQWVYFKSWRENLRQVNEPKHSRLSFQEGAWEKNAAGDGFPVGPSQTIQW